MMYIEEEEEILGQISEIFSNLTYAEEMDIITKYLIMFAAGYEADKGESAMNLLQQFTKALLKLYEQHGDEFVQALKDEE